MEALLAGAGGNQSNNAAIQAQKAQERQATQMQPFVLESVGHNVRQIGYIRSTSLALAGSIAGILGLRSLSGLLFFLFSLLLTNIAILVLSCHSAPHKYLLNPPPQSPLGLVFGIGSSVATAAAIASPGIMAYGAAAVLGGMATSANSWGITPRAQEVVGGQDGKKLGQVVWWLSEGVKGEVLSFLLWWTFWNAIVHVYE